MKRLTPVLTLLLLTVGGSAAAFAQDYGGATDPLQNALENNRTNQASTWVNPDSGASGTVVPVRTFQNAQGLPCREFQRSIVIGGRQELGYGTACRQPDGTWHTVATQRAAAPVERRTTVYVREVPRPRYTPYYPSYPYGYSPYRADPYGYYAPWGYGYPYWFPFHFTFDLGFLFHSGHHHRGHRGHRR
jgi:surface antigen